MSRGPEGPSTERETGTILNRRVKNYPEYGGITTYIQTTTGGGVLRSTTRYKLIGRPRIELKRFTQDLKATRSELFGLILLSFLILITSFLYYFLVHFQLILGRCYFELNLQIALKIKR